MSFFTSVADTPLCCSASIRTMFERSSRAKAVPTSSSTSTLRRARARQSLGARDASPSSHRRVAVRISPSRALVLEYSIAYIGSSSTADAFLRFDAAADMFVDDTLSGCLVCDGASAQRHERAERERSDAARRRTSEWLLDVESTRSTGIPDSEANADARQAVRLEARTRASIERRIRMFSFQRLSTNAWRSPARDDQ